MDQVLNGKERNQAFVKFMVLFILSIAIIVYAVYFDFRVPQKDNHVLRERIQNYENQLYNQQQFTTLMESAKALIDSMNRLEKSNPLLDHKINDQLASIQTPSYLNTGIYATLNQDIFNLMYNYYNSSKQLLESKEYHQKYKGLQDELEQTKHDLSDAQRDLETCRKSNIQPY